MNCFLPIVICQLAHNSRQCLEFVIRIAQFTIAICLTKIQFMHRNRTVHNLSFTFRLQHMETR